VLTGAAGGLGSAVARACVREGAAGLLLSDINEQAADELRQELADGTTQVLAQQADVASRAAVGELVERAQDSWGGTDVLINNAGILTPSARTHNVTEDDFRRIIGVNLLGVYNGMHAVLPGMRANGGGVIINTASVAGLTAWTHSGPYCATKAAVIHLSKVAAIEYAKENIRVNTVCPGGFLTAIHDGLSEESLQVMADRHPIGRMAASDEVAGAFVYLASDESSFVTGTSIVVDGGYSAP
jgi:NAD(P)-dependent dehydrogenase (short-subunit alcohol dehydrogenase family)